MLKYACNFAVHTKFLKFVKEGDLVKRFLVRIEKVANAQKQGNNPFMENYFIHKSRGANFFCKKPVVVLSGILSLLGFGEKPPEEPELIMAIKRGILHMQRQEYDKSEKELHNALKLAIEENDEDGITYVYDILANLAFETGQYAKARKLFLSLLQRLTAKGKEVTSNEFVHISLKLAKTFEDAKELSKAEEGYKYCIETLDKRLENEEENEDTLALWGMSMDWYARFLLNVNKKEEALACFKKAYEMCVKVNGTEHEQTVILLNDIGTVSSLIGDTESAMNYFEKARDIGKNLPEMRDLAAIYINLGQLYMLREMYSESKASCLEGFKRAKECEDEVASLEAQQCLQEIEKAVKISKNAKGLPSEKADSPKGFKNEGLFSQVTGLFRSS